MYKRKATFNKWLKTHRSRKFRHKINRIVRMYKKEEMKELHLPLIKDVYDPWSWD